MSDPAKPLSPNELTRVRVAIGKGKFFRPQTMAQAVASIDDLTIKLRQEQQRVRSLLGDQLQAQGERRGLLLRIEALQDQLKAVNHEH